MILRFGQRPLWLIACVALAVLPALPVRGATQDPAASSLNWVASSNRVDARISGWPLTRVLGRIAEATGWDVYVEPGTDRPIHATFSDLAPRQALTRLLGGLNFSLQPQASGPSRLLIYRTDRDQATRRIAMPPRAGRIVNELIVRLKPGFKGSIESLAQSLGGVVVGKLASANAYRLRFETPEAAEAARRKLEALLEEVAAVENNYRWELPAEAASDVATPAAAAGGTLQPRFAPDGEQLVVGIIDTAAQPLSNGREAFVLSRTDIVPGQPADEGIWHGTAMAETFLKGLEMADNSEGGSTVRLRLYNAYGGNEAATTFDVTQAVFQAAQDGVSILSLSLGGPNGSPLLSDALGSFVNQGGLVFVAAGNHGTDAPFFPAADPAVIAVSAINRDGQRMPWANYGSYVDVGAPGTSVVPFNGMNWVVNGTSPATALTAGMGAGYAARTGKPLADVRTAILTQMPFNP
ncbi:MAG: S8 family serine peptidase [Verrucomicrobiae bacterium]|nr:S8 family serine peptidase [Verrucomicrobiae bacterium]